MALSVGFGWRRFLKVSLMKPSIETSDMFVTILPARKNQLLEYYVDMVVVLIHELVLRYCPFASNLQINSMSSSRKLFLSKDNCISNSISDKVARSSK